MKRMTVFACLPLAVGLSILHSGCVTTHKPPVSVEAPVTRAEQQEAQKVVAATPAKKTFKRKVAIGRFTNETMYGKALLGGSTDPLGKQTSDMLSTYLVDSGKFIVLERPELGLVKEEQQILQQSDVPGADTLIIGSVTEFGRKNEGQTGFLSANRTQVAYAKVFIRLVDVRTSYAFFSATGTGESTTQTGHVAGFGSHADYDATLNDKAIAAAVADMINGIVQKLEERPWSSDILKVDGSTVYITGGQKQGIAVGDILSIQIPGDTVKSQQSGFPITLPATPVASIRIVSQFGDNDSNEGSVAEVASGNVPQDAAGKLMVGEQK